MTLKIRLCFIVPIAISLSTQSLLAFPQAEFKLSSPGSETIVDYEKYGNFIGVGTLDYRYEITDVEGLGRAVGEGVYPNQSHLDDEAYHHFLASNKEPIDPWKHVASPFPKEDFFAWIGSQDADEGTKLFFIAEVLRSAGLISEAIKAYYALIVHFPKTILWSMDGQIHWYPALEAISRVRKLCATYPELGIQLEGAFLDVQKSATHDPAKDAMKVWPGKFIKVELKKTFLQELDVVEERGGKKVKVVKFSNGHWQLQKDGKPFLVRGISYTASTVGESAHAFNLRSWMNVDDNENGLNDGMFDSWVDQNRNNARDDDEMTVGDAVLLKAMGANAIRFFHGQDARGEYDPAEYNKPLMRTLAKDYGIYFVMGDFLGAYTIGSGAAWEAGTDYRDMLQRSKMKQMVRAMVLDHKDEPYVLFWLLGNENQFTHTRTNAVRYPQDYAAFVNEVAQMIKELDGDHPVAVGNLHSVGLREMAEFAPDVDIYGANVYAGQYSMGSIVQQVKHYYDRPLLFTEWGADAYHSGEGPDEEAQAAYITGNWKDIELHTAGETGEGNIIGGILFEWMDEWWKSTQGDGWGDPWEHNTEGDYRLPYPDGWCHEEWLGIIGQGNGEHSPMLRERRRAYDVIQKLWVGDEV